MRPLLFQLFITGAIPTWASRGSHDLHAAPCVYVEPAVVRQSLLCSGLGPFGEAPVSYFAPEPRLAAGTDADAAARELKQVVAALHREGIEVLLQVCGHTQEHEAMW